MVCIIKCIKCCTDRVLGAINCVGVPGATGLIIAKAYDVPKIDDIEWGYIMLPATTLVTLNIAYYTCCKLLLQKKKSQQDEVDIELGPV